MLTDPDLTSVESGTLKVKLHLLGNKLIRFKVSETKYVVSSCKNHASPATSWNLILCSI